MSYYFISHSVGKVIKKAANAKKAINSIPDKWTGVAMAEVNTDEFNVCLPCDDLLNKQFNFCPKCNAEVKQLK